MLKWISQVVFALTLAHTAWVEWSVLKSAGILWGLFFGMFFIPFALSATLAIFPLKSGD